MSETNEESSLSVLLTAGIIDVLRDRKGFRWWWDDIDEEIQQDIIDCVHAKIIEISGG